MLRDKGSGSLVLMGPDASLEEEHGLGRQSRESSSGILGLSDFATESAHGTGKASSFVLCCEVGLISICLS